LKFTFAVLVAVSLFAVTPDAPVRAQQNPSTPSAAKPGGSSQPAIAQQAPLSAKIDMPEPKADVNAGGEPAGQRKRILWIIPNFKAVDANTQLPPLSVKQKFWLATQDSTDYSSFIYVGMVAGISMAGKSEPSFGQGASGYGIYYAHSYADGFIENYMVEAIVPTLTKQDPRYYTLGHGGFFKRAGYAASQLLVTRTDSGKRTFNISEIAGAGAAAGISNAYYPPGNTWVKTYQRWGSQVLQDGLGNLLKEFWPDIDRAIFHNKY
jgi:hypothetical protein